MIGNAKDFSEIDLAKINKMYKCDQKSPSTTGFLGAAKAQVVFLSVFLLSFKDISHICSWLLQRL